MLQSTPNLVSTLRDIKSRNACNGFLIFLGILRDFVSKIFSKNPKKAKITPENSRKMTKNQKIKNPLNAFLDLMSLAMLTKFGIIWSI